MTYTTLTSRVTRLLFVCGLLSVVFTACAPREELNYTDPLRVSVFLPDSCRLSEAHLIIEDRNMGTQLTFTDGQIIGDTCVVYDIRLGRGYYACTFEATVQVSTDYTYPLRAYEQSITLSEPTEVTMHAFAVNKSDDFVLAEVFFAGTQTPEGKNYIGDKYFVLVNNSDSLLYADGIVLVESKFKNTKQFTVTPDIMASAMAADAIYRVPGDGTRFPVQPGAAFLIADNAIDHRTINSLSFDMSDANVEWYDVSTNANVTDVDNPDVTNMDKIYCYTLTIWVPNNQGNTTFAIGRMPADITVEQYLQDYRYDYDYINVTQAGTFEMSASAYRFPNAWIIDAVNLCPHSEYQWLAVHQSLDAGFAYVGETGSDRTRFGKCVRRKRADDGKLVDTNNSSADFLMSQDANPHYFLQ